MLRENIGEGDNALLCTTDSNNCCMSPFRAGEFYFPDGAQVPNPGNVGSNGYYRDRDYQLIRLNQRQSHNAVIAGQFRCEIPSLNETNSVLYIYIGKHLNIVLVNCDPNNSYMHVPSVVDISATIFPAGNNTSTAGEIHRLECSILVTGSTDIPAITWLYNDIEIINSSSDATRTVSMTSNSANGSYSSTLMFNPLSTSDAGWYTCRVTLDGAEVNQSTNVVVIKGKLGRILV